MKSLDCSFDNPPPQMTVGQKVLLVCKSTEPLMTPTEAPTWQLESATPHSFVTVGDLKIDGQGFQQFITSHKVGSHNYQNITVQIGSETYGLPPLSLTVGSVLQGQEKPTPYGPYGAIQLGAPWWWWTLWILFAVLVIAYFTREVIKYRKIRRELLAQKAAHKILNPEEQFFTDLRKIESQGFHIKGEYKTFAFALSGVVKKGLSAKFIDKFEDMTTEEIIKNLQTKQKTFFDSSGSRLSQFLTELDYVKFSKQDLTAEHCSTLMDQASQLGNGIFGRSP